MSLNTEKIEHLEHQFGGRSHSRKWMKNQRNRKIRRVKTIEVPKINKMYHGWEY